MKDLVLHIGLWKTGTTTLQREFFPTADGFLGGRSSPRNPPEFDAFGRLHRRGAEVRDYDTDEQRQDAAAWWSRVDRIAGQRILISDEALNLGTPTLREGGTPGPQPLIGFIRHLQTVIGDAARIRVILTLRNQVDFLGSTYAESSHTLPSASQKHFVGLAARQPSDPGRSLDWMRRVRDLEAVIGREDLSVHIFEDGLEAIAHEMAAFYDLGCRPVLDLPRHSVRAAGSGAWSVAEPTARSRRIRWVLDLPGRVWPRDRAPYVWDRAMIVLSDHRVAEAVGRQAAAIEHAGGRRIREVPEIRASVRDALGASNRDLQRWLGRDLSSLGWEIARA